jgi:hypothetical protein
MSAALWLAVFLSAAPASPEKPKLIVLDLGAAGGVEPQVASALSEAVATEVASKGFFQVISSKDLQTLIGVERQKQVMGCSDNSSCLTELSGAIGARFVMNGSVAKLGDAYQLSLQTLDSATAQPTGRSSRIAKDLAALRAQVPFAVAEATGTSLPPPPSRLLTYSLLGAGSLCVVAGGIVGFNGLSREQAVRSELERGKTNPAVLRTSEEYLEEERNIRGQKTFSLLSLGLGVGLIGLGVALNPDDPRTVGSVQVALVPSSDGVTHGATVLGVFP